MTKIKLNPEQKKAVEFGFGPLLVVAGAGTGKTGVITQRIKHLLDADNAEVLVDKDSDIKKDPEALEVSPKNILALTFTEKAATEMLERVDDVMPLGYEEPWINTFHSFADKILKAEALEIGLDPSYKILTSPQQWLLFRQNLFEFDLEYFRPLGNPTKFISAILKFISRLQDENISPQEFLKFASDFEGDKEEKDRWLELAKTYQKYEEIKIKNSRLDFGDLITWTIKLFKDRPNILKKYQNQFRHVLVDEFQDTNYAQYELLKILCPVESLKKRSFLVVGDDSQSIYKFRGAAVSNILQFMDDYKDAEMVTLVKNYRSTQQILDAAYKVVQNNNPDTLESKLGISKELKSQNEKDKGSLEVFELASGEEEAEFVVRKIVDLLSRESELNFKDVAILARANSHLDTFLLALRRFGMPYQLVGNRGLYDREEIRNILALVRAVINPLDSISLYRVLHIDAFEISTELVANLLATSKYKKIPLWESVKNAEDDEVQILKNKILNYQDQIAKKSPVEFVFGMLTDINYLGGFLKEETVENELCVRNINSFLEKIKQFEIEFRSNSSTRELPTVVDLVDYLDLMIEAGEDPAQAEIEDFNTVSLMTVHASKGLEFPVVFMVNLVSDRFPTRNRKDAIELPDVVVKEDLPQGDPHVQEERRLFYVGMTRAMKHLILTYAKNYGGKRDKRLSGYVEETQITPIKTDQKTQEEKEIQEQESLFGLNSGFRDPITTKTDSIKLKFLSYSQVNTYDTCPLMYKYRYIMNVPTGPNHALSFGNTIHATLNDYHKIKMHRPVDHEEILELYEKNWDPLGYIDAAHRELRFESGKTLIEDYWNKTKDEKIDHVGLEKSFNVYIAGTRFFGKIDRIDPLPNGGVEIIDYKTGSTKDQKFVDKDKQVTFYAIAAKEALGLDPKKLTYYYVESNEKLSTTRNEEDIQNLKAEVKEVVEDIKAQEFKAKPGMHCSWCDYKEICPFAYRK